MADQTTELLRFLFGDSPIAPGFAPDAGQAAMQSITQDRILANSPPGFIPVAVPDEVTRGQKIGSVIADALSAYASGIAQNPGLRTDFLDELRKRREQRAAAEAYNKGGTEQQKRAEAIAAAKARVEEADRNRDITREDELTARGEASRQAEKLDDRSYNQRLADEADAKSVVRDAAIRGIPADIQRALADPNYRLQLLNRVGEFDRKEKEDETNRRLDDFQRKNSYEADKEAQAELRAMIFGDAESGQPGVYELLAQTDPKARPQLIKLLRHRAMDIVSGLDMSSAAKQALRRRIVQELEPILDEFEPKPQEDQPTEYPSRQLAPGEDPVVSLLQSLGARAPQAALEYATGQPIFSALPKIPAGASKFRAHGR